MRRRLLPGRACRRGCSPARSRSRSEGVPTASQLPPSLDLRRRLRHHRPRRAGLERPEDARLARAARRRARPFALHTVYRAVAPDQLALHDLEALVGDHHRHQALGPGDAGRDVGRVARSYRRSVSRSPFWAAVTDARVLGRRIGRRQAGLDRLVLRPGDAGVVRGAGRGARPVARSCSP